MPPDVWAEMIAGLTAAAAGTFTPRFYRVRLSPRREIRRRRPGMASRLSLLEARAIQAFQYFGGCSINELATRFRRSRATIRKALYAHAAFMSESCSGARPPSEGE